MSTRDEIDFVIDEKALASMQRIREIAATGSVQSSEVFAGDDDCDCDCQDCD